MTQGKHFFIYKDYTFLIEKGVQAPDSYSFFLEESIILNKGETALDIVTGSGFHAILMAQSASKVIGVDINCNSVRCAKINTFLNNADNIVEIRQGDLFSSIALNEKFDLIIAWPPIMPTPVQKERQDWVGTANNAGIYGRTIIDRIIEKSNLFLREGGRLQLLQPSYTNVPLSLDMLERKGFTVEITATKEFPVGQLSFERSYYFKELGFPLLEKNGQLIQEHFVITAWWKR
jgi:release factor glutamine methyltransferase